MKGKVLISLIAVTLMTAGPAAFARARGDTTTETVASVFPGLMPTTGEGMEVSEEIGPFQEESVGEHILSHTDLYWTGQLNGPSLGTSMSRNYNPFQNDYGPMYLYHTIDAINYLGWSDTVGVEVSAKQDFGRAVPNREGWPVTPVFTANDPQIWYRHNGVLDLPFLRVDGALSLFPGVTDYSRTQDYMLLSTALDGTYHIKTASHPWNLYFTTRVRPTFYTRKSPYFYWKQEQVFFSTGHYLGYRFSDRFELAHSSALDFDYYTDGSGTFLRGNAYDDRHALQLNYYIPAGYGRIGAYVQGLIAHPALETSTVGIDLTINFLRHRL
jgi:hypothetical protein